MLNDDGNLNQESYARIKYALNGAVHYATALANKTSKKVFAVGIAGTESHYDMTVAFLAPSSEPKLLEGLETLTPFSIENINEYHRVTVLGELPREERDAREIRKVAGILHEGMGNYA